MNIMFKMIFLNRSNEQMHKRQAESLLKQTIEDFRGNGHGGRPGRLKSSR